VELHAEVATDGEGLRPERVASDLGCQRRELDYVLVPRDHSAGGDEVGHELVEAFGLLLKRLVTATIEYRDRGIWDHSRERVGVLSGEHEVF